MGAGASSTDGSISEREDKFFKEMQNTYDNEYKPQIAERKMERQESLDFFQAKINSFVESEPKSDEKRVPARAIVSRTTSSAQPPPTYYVGDIVKAKVDGMMFEGVVVHNGEDDDTIDVDFGDEIETVLIGDCALVMSGLDFEVGDLVQARTVDTVLYCHGTILNINHDATMDILFAGDDDEDVEKNIPHNFVRKHRTGREMVKKRWHRARAMLATVRAFAH